MLYIGKLNEIKPKRETEKERRELHENLREMYRGGKMHEKDKWVVFPNFISSFIGE